MTNEYIKEKISHIKTTVLANAEGSLTTGRAGSKYYLGIDNYNGFSWIEISERLYLAVQSEPNLYNGDVVMKTTD